MSEPPLALLEDLASTAAQERWIVHATKDEYTPTYAEEAVLRAHGGHAGASGTAPFLPRPRWRRRSSGRRELPGPQRTSHDRTDLHGDFVESRGKTVQLRQACAALWRIAADEVLARVCQRLQVRLCSAAKGQPALDR